MMRADDCDTVGRVILKAFGYSLIVIAILNALAVFRAVPRHEIRGSSLFSSFTTWLIVDSHFCHMSIND